MTIRYAVLLLVIFVAAVLCFQPTSSAPAQVQPQLQFVGQQLFPQKVALLGAEASGLVTSMPYEPQDFVKADDLLVQLDADLVDIEIERVQAQIEMDEGIRNAEIVLNFRRENLNTAQDLYNIILDSSDDPNNAIRVGSWKELQEAKQLFELAELEDTRARLALKELHLNLRRFQKNKEQMEIRAPWDGVIVKFSSLIDIPSVVQSRQVEADEMVQAGQPIVALMKVDILKTVFQLPVTELPRVSLNQKAKVTIQGFANETIDARVSYINPKVNAGMTVDVEVEFANPPVFDDQAPQGVYRYRFRPGMGVSVELIPDN